MPQIGVLAAYQQSGDRARTFVSKEVAGELVRRLAAQKISAKMIRLFPDDSSFEVLKAFRFGDPAHPPASYPPVELPTCRFLPPKNSASPSLQMAWDWKTEPGYLNA